MAPAQTITSGIFSQLIDVAAQLSDEQYSGESGLLSGNSIGKHVRHIIEFFECLLAGYESGVIDYDARARNEAIENSTGVAIRTLEAISARIGGMSDKQLLLLSEYPGIDGKCSGESSFNREIVYNIEHAIHHMAIIKIALQSDFPEVKLPENFGIAWSTIKHQNKQCAP